MLTSTALVLLMSSRRSDCSWRIVRKNMLGADAGVRGLLAGHRALVRLGTRLRSRGQTPRVLAPFLVARSIR
jgi:hypothetical protein